MNLIKYNPKRNLEKRGWTGPDFFRSLFAFDPFDFDNYTFDSWYNQDVIQTKETENEYLARIELAGYNKDEIKIEVSDGKLRIKAEKKEKDTNFELSGVYLNQINLPDYLDCSKADAKLENGILLISIPKQIKEKSQIRIT